MLDHRKMKMIEQKLINPSLSNAELARRVGVSRQSIWEWSKDKEVQAELDRRLRSITQAANYHLRTQTSELMGALLEIALSDKTETRVRNSALQYLIDRSMGRAPETVNIDLQENTSNPEEVLRQFQEFLDRNGYAEKGEDKDE